MTTRCSLASPCGTVIILDILWCIFYLASAFRFRHDIAEGKHTAFVLTLTCQVNPETSGQRDALIEISGPATQGKAW